MKRISLAVTSLVMYLIFFILYGISATRDFFSSLNANFAGVYNNLYDFFNFTWDKTFAHIIVYDPTGLHHPIVYGVAQVFIWLAVLVLIVELIATVVVNRRKNTSEKFGKIIAAEKENLLKADDRPVPIKENENQGEFANNAAPFVSLEEPTSLDSEGVLIDPRIKKPRPAIRIIISIILFILTGFFIYLRMLWKFNYPGQYDLFYGLFHMDNIIFMNTELTAFFGALFQRAYSVPLGVIAGLAWTWGDMMELIAILLFVAIVWGLILLISHFIISDRRRKKLRSNAVDIADYENKFSSETLSVMGNADLKSVDVDVSYIAKITPSFVAKERNKQMHNQAMYIYDISENVKPAGTIPNTQGYIPPTEVRKPLVSEELEEDLSGNLNVDISDISSIEDNEPEEVINYNGYIGEKESVTKVDLSDVNVESIASIQDRLAVEHDENTVDDISFDEDGYAYLVKKGKPFVDEQADISDVIDSNDLQKSVIISRYGNENFEALNSLEPFDLKELDYEEEIENIKLRKRAIDVISADKLLKDSLSKKAFSETNIRDIKDVRIGSAKETSVKPKVTSSYSKADLSFSTDGKDREKIVKSTPEKDFEPAVKTESKVEESKREIQKNIIAYNVPKVNAKEFKPDEHFDEKAIIPVKPKEVNKNNKEEETIKKPLIKPIRPLKPLSPNLDTNKKMIRPVEVKKENFVGSFVDSIGESRKKSGDSNSSNANKIKFVKIKAQGMKNIEKEEKKDSQLNNIVSIESTNSKKEKPKKPVDAKKVDYDIFIGKKK